MIEIELTREQIEHIIERLEIMQEVDFSGKSEYILKLFNMYLKVNNA